MANNIPRNIILFPLKEGSLEINVPNRPTAIGSQLTSQTKTRAGCGGTIRLLIKALFVLESTQDPACLALIKGSIRFALDRQNPASCDKVPGLVLSHVHQLKDLMLLPAFIFRALSLIKLLHIVLKLFLGGFLARSINAFSTKNVIDMPRRCCINVNRNTVHTKRNGEAACICHNPRIPSQECPSSWVLIN